MHRDRARVWILRVPGARGDDLEVGARGGDARRGRAEDWPVTLDLLPPAPREQAQCWPARIEADSATRIRARRRGRPVFERMYDERRGDSPLAKKRFFE